MSATEQIKKLRETLERYEQAQRIMVARERSNPTSFEENHRLDNQELEALGLRREVDLSSRFSTSYYSAGKTLAMRIAQVKRDIDRLLPSARAELEEDRRKEDAKKQSEIEHMLLTIENAIKDAITTAQASPSKDKRRHGHTLEIARAKYHATKEARKNAGDLVKELQRKAGWEHLAEVAKQKQDQLANDERRADEEMRIALDLVYSTFGNTSTPHPSVTMGMSIAQYQNFINRARNKADDLILAKRAPDNDPITSSTHTATREEMRYVIQALKQIAQDGGEDPYEVEFPEIFLISPRMDQLAYMSNHTAVISQGLLEDAYALVPALAHLLGWCNSTFVAHSTIARNLAYPFGQETLDQLIRNTWDTSSSLLSELFTAIGVPEDLRPSPPDVITGGGHDFSNLHFSMKSREMSDFQIPVNLRNFSWDTTYSGKQAADMYTSILGGAPRQYFEIVKDMQMMFRDHQRLADRYAAVHMKQSRSLIEFLKHRQVMAGVETTDKIPFGYPISVRVAYLQAISDQMSEGVWSSNIS